jgi:vacuolar-type H+-ATPase subunit I/STV1
MSEKTTEKAGDKPKPTVDELRAEIKQTRAELGETVQALAAKADVKARALDQVEQAKQRLAGVAGQAQERVRTSPVPFSLVLAGVAAVVGVILIVRGSRR